MNAAELATATIKSVVTLRDGNSLPLINLGVYLAETGDETKNACLVALKNGYVGIDTAQFYENEADVGAALRESGADRDAIYITSKMWTMGRSSKPAEVEAYEAVQSSLRESGLERLDLYLLHSPHGDRLGRWRGLLKARDDGLVSSVGVSNYGVHHLEEIENAKLELPSVNQVELHAFCGRFDLVDFCASRDVVVEAYSPLAKARRLDDQILVGIAKAKNKTVAQVMLRHLLQRGVVVLPKSVRETRIVENAAVFDFTLSEDEMKAINALDEGLVTGWDPTTMK